MCKVIIQFVSFFRHCVLTFVSIVSMCSSIILSTHVHTLAMPNNSQGSETKLQVIATTFPIYLFTRNIVSNRNYIKVDLLITSQSGCPHDYSPGPADMTRLSNADIIIKYGMGLDANIDKILKNVASKARLVDASHGISSASSTASTHVCQDPHIHASPDIASRMVVNIAKALSTIDPEGAGAYMLAAEKYTAKLLSTGRILNSCCAHLPKRGIILQQSSLTHLVDAAGLEIVAIIEEEEGKTPSAAQLMEIIKIAKDGKTVLIACEAKLSDKLANTVAEESGLPVIRLDSLSFGPTDAPNSFYETIMARNCQILGQSLGIKQ